MDAQGRGESQPDEIPGPAERDEIAALAIGRSAVRRRILELLLAERAPRYHLRDLQRRAGTTPGTASRELARLVAAGLAERTAEGQHVYFAAGRSPIVDTLRRLAASAEPRDTEVAAPVEPGPAGAAAPTGPDPVAVEAGRRFAAALAAIYGQRLVEVALVGSRATSAVSPAADSDVNVVVVLERFDSYGDEIERTSLAAATVSLDLGVQLSRFVVSLPDWVAADRPPIRSLRSGAVTL